MGLVGYGGMTTDQASLFCMNVSNASHFSLILNHFNALFCSAQISFAFVHCRPQILDFIFEKKLPFNKEALFHCASNGNQQVLSRILGAYRYPKVVLCQALKKAAIGNHMDVYNQLWELVDRDRYWTARTIDSFAKSRNIEQVRLLINEMDRQDLILKEEFRVANGNYKSFRPPIRSINAIGLSNSLEMAQLLHSRNVPCDEFKLMSMEYYPEEVIMFLLEKRYMHLTWLTILQIVAAKSNDFCKTIIKMSSTTFMIQDYPHNYSTYSTLVYMHLCARDLLEEAEMLGQRLKDKSWVLKPNEMISVTEMCKKASLESIIYFFTGFGQSYIPEINKIITKLTDQDKIMYLNKIK